MRRRIALLIASVCLLVVMLMPAGSAQAASFQNDYFCQNVVLAPGQSCTSWPLNVNWIWGHWTVTKQGTGRVCVGLTQYGGSQHGQPVPGIPGLECPTVGWGWSGGEYGKLGRVGDTKVQEWKIGKYNPYLTYSYRYGQARITNFSSATIKVLTWSSVRHWR